MAKKENIILLEKFIESKFKDMEIFKELCLNDINLKGYLCAPEKLWIKNLKAIKKLDTAKEMLNYLIDNQPCINKTVESFDAAIKLLAGDIENYVTFYAYKLVNAFGSVEDYTQDLYAKYYYMVNFYRTRWFFKKTLNKSTRVKWKPMTYKEFSYLAKATVASEKRLKAYKFRTNPEATTNKISLDQYIGTSKTIDGKEARVGDFLVDSLNTNETLLMDVHYKFIIRKALEFVSSYENGKYTEKISQLLLNPSLPASKIEKILLKVSLYKAGLNESLKVLKFIDTLSGKYKEKFGISQALLNRQIEKVKLNPNSEGF